MTNANVRKLEEHRELTCWSTQSCEILSQITSQVLLPQLRKESLGRWGRNRRGLGVGEWDIILLISIMIMSYQ